MLQKIALTLDLLIKGHTNLLVLGIDELWPLAFVLFRLDLLVVAS
jgi:hypothetical protein